MIELDIITKADVAADGQPKQWRSLAHRATPPSQAALDAEEFHPAAPDAEDDAASGPSRRSFMKMMGASMALAGVGLSGCRRPVEKILPYARQPEEVLPGIANFYATAMPLGGVVHPLLVQSYEGRPTKIEGNPDHPATAGGKSSMLAQASVYNLYDPDRARVVRRGGAEATWSDFVSFARQIGGGARLAVLAEASSSLTTQRLRTQLAGRFPDARWITYRAPGENVAGGAVRPIYRFSQAQTIVSFDGDFLGDPITGVWNASEYAESRRVMAPGDSMSRLYVVESSMTSTGGMADHRLRMRASDIPAFAQAVGGALGQGGGAGTFADPQVTAFAEAVAEDARAGATVFVAGPTQPASVHALCASLNAAYGGGAVDYVDTGAPAEVPLAQALPALVRDMEAGQVDVLLMIGVNPVYDAPADLRFADALERVAVSIHLGSHRDETARRSTWSLPRAHYLEAWGDGRAVDGSISVIQPLIAPLYEAAHSEIEVLNVLVTGTDAPGYDLVRDTFRQQGLIAGAFEDGWRTLLHDGFLPNTALAGGGQPTFADGGQPAQASQPGQVELVIRTDGKLYDGTFSNNPWLLELPESVTKVTWDNVAMISPALAERLQVRYDDRGYEGGRVQAGRINASLITITAPNNAQVTLPVWVQPGHPDDSITVHTGWGRDFATDRTLDTTRNLFDRVFTVDVNHFRFGPISNGVGQPVGMMRSAAGPAVIPSVQVEVTGGTHLIATTQDHGTMANRPIVRMATLAEFNERPLFAQEAVGLIGAVPWEEYPPMWGEENTPHGDPRWAEAKYSDHQWGMTVDLNTCSGCNACVVACQAENNISVVGKDEVARGREMHWLRLDRYYVGDDVAQPGMVMMPMMCQHCEYAPCESVCPVSATSHSPDGLNEMTYNRCIGTRYCSNNCPYKVRRYNWFNWFGDYPQEPRMQLNPNVTTRFRGVMEKCTWCIHRIRLTNRYAHIENRKIRDGEVQTACQQACPADAIVFGDIADPDSRVSQLKRTARRYELLEEYNIKPRLSYLARLSNPHPRLAAVLGHPEGEHVPEVPGPTRESVPVTPHS